MRTYTFLFCSLLLVLTSTHGNAQEPPSLGVFLFHNEECDSCESALQSYLSTLKSTYPFLEVKSFDARDPSNRELLGTFKRKLGRTEDELPVAFVEDHVLSGEKEITEKLEFYALEYQIRNGLTQPLLGIQSKDKP